jgi:hypothetical protein
MARLHPGEIQQILHQRGQPFGVAIGDGQEAIGLVWLLLQCRPRRLQRRAHRRQRRAQLVGDVGHEVLADRLQPANLGDVHQHHQRPATVVGQGGGVHQEPARPRAIHRHLTGGGPLPLQGLADHGLQSGAANGLQQGSAQQRRGGVRPAGGLVRGLEAREQQHPGRGVGHHDGPGRIHHQHPLLHGLQNAPQPIALLAQGAQGAGQAVGQLIQGARQLPDLVAGLRPDAHVQIARGDLAGGGGDPAQRTPEDLAGQRRQQQGHPQGHRRPGEHQLAQPGLGLLHLGQPHRQAHHDGPAASGGRPAGQVQHAPLDGGAVPLGPARSHGERQLYLLTAAVVGHPGQVPVGHIRVPQHRAPRVHEGHACPRGPSQLIGQRVPLGGVVFDQAALAHVGLDQRHPHLQIGADALDQVVLQAPRQEHIPDQHRHHQQRRGDHQQPGPEPPASHQRLSRNDLRCTRRCGCRAD